MLAEIPPSIPEYAESTPLLAAPTDYVRRWSTEGSTAYDVSNINFQRLKFKPGSFWEPICPRMATFLSDMYLEKRQIQKPDFNVMKMRAHQGAQTSARHRKRFGVI
jgi:hypothetical protein